MGPSPDFQGDSLASQNSFNEAFKRRLRPPRWLKYVHLIFTVGLGSCMLLGALFFFLRSGVFVYRATATTGKVIDHDVKTSTSTGSGSNRSSTTTSYRPVVQFQLQGETITFVSKAGNNSPGDQPVGSEVPVLFNPKDPHNAEIDSFSAIWGGSVFMIVFGTIWTTVGVVSYRVLWNEDR